MSSSYSPGGMSAKLNDRPNAVGVHSKSDLESDEGKRGRGAALATTTYTGDDATAGYASTVKAARNKQRNISDGATAEDSTANEEGADWIDDADETKRTTRRYLIELRFSMIEAEENPAAVRWNVHQGMFYAFKKREPTSAPGSTDRKGNLERALLLGGAVHYAASSAPVVLNVKFAGMRGNRYTNAGRRTPFWVMPGDNHHFSPPEIIFKPDDNVFSSQVKNYSNLTEADIEARIMRDPEVDYSFVPTNHCVARVVRINHEMLGVDLDTMEVMDGRYKFHNKLVEKCQQTLRKHIFEVLPFSDLSAWKVELERADGLPFGAPENVQDLGENEEIQHELMEKQNRVIIDLELSFYLCGDDEPAATPK